MWLRHFFLILLSINSAIVNALLVDLTSRNASNSENLGSSSREDEGLAVRRWPLLADGSFFLGSWSLAACLLAFSLPHHIPPPRTPGRPGA